jgi:hypothetical protein
LGIGATSPSYYLEVRTNNVADQGIKVWGYSADGSKNSNIYFGDNNGTNSYVLRFVNTFGGGTGELYGLNLRSLNTSADFNVVAGTLASPITGLTLKGNTGNVGIGTSSPSSANGSDRFLVIAGSASADVASLVLDPHTGNAHEFQSYNGTLKIFNSTTQQMTLDASGNLLVGTTGFTSAPAITKGLIAGNFRSLYATATIGAGATTTILTLSSSATGVYIVQANFGGQGNQIYGGMLIVVANLGSFRIVTNGSGSSCALTLSGADVQITNAIGVPLDATGTAILIGNGA